MELSTLEKLDVLKDEYLPMIISLDSNPKPSFEEYLTKRINPFFGKMVFRDGNWFLIIN